GAGPISFTTSAEKNRAPRGARLQVLPAWGAGNIQRGTCCSAGLLWEDTHPAQQRAHTMRAAEWASNAAPRMTAMPNPLQQFVAQFYRRKKYSTPLQPIRMFS